MTTDDKPATERLCMALVENSWGATDTCMLTFGHAGEHDPEAHMKTIAALRVDLIDAMTPELGPRMARAAVLGPDISPEDAETYSRATGSINVRHVSLNADGTFTLAYEEGAMDSKPKTPEHPAPWRWEKIGMGGEFLSDANGRWILDDDTGEATPLPESVKALIASAPEMEALLREVQWNGRGHQQCPFCVGHRHPSGMPDDMNFGHRPGCRLAALLARVDAAGKGT